MLNPDEVALIKQGLDILNKKVDVELEVVRNELDMTRRVCNRLEGILDKCEPLIDLMIQSAMAQLKKELSNQSESKKPADKVLYDQHDYEEI
jgi:hypothetical protein